MPFTFSHPAIFVPLLKYNRFFSATGLIVGTLTPDFEYFLKMRISSECSHTYLGMFYFDLPIGFLICILFHWIIRDVFIENSPNFIQKRIIRWHGINWISELISRWFIVLISILIGAFSHIFWDEFTHVHGLFVLDSEFFNQSVNFLGRRIPVYKFFQHGSSLIGAIIIIASFFSLPKKHSEFHPNLSFWATFFIVVVFTFLFRLEVSNWKIGIGNAVVSIMSSCMLGLIVASIGRKRLLKIDH